MYNFFSMNTGVRLGCIYTSSFLTTCLDWALGKIVDQNYSGASVGNTKVTDFVFADDAVILAQSPEVLVIALEVLQEEARPLELQVSWAMTKVQVFGSLLDQTEQSVHMCGQDIDILKVSHTLAVYCRKMAGLVKKFYGRYALPTVLWIQPA